MQSFMNLRLFLTALLVALALVFAGCDEEDETPALASARPTSAPRVAPPSSSPDGGPTAQPGTFRAYYLNKYPETERAPVERLLGEVLSHYSPEQQQQAVGEILAFHHVVFHETEWHRLDRNHAAIRSYEEKLREFCELHEVPFLPVLAIVSWENSGGSDRVSSANAAGLGQMTWGAMQEAYNYSAELSRQSLKKARWQKYMAGVTGDPEDMKEARRLAAMAARYDLRTRHKQLARAANVDDVRMLPEANLECVVVFYKFLLDSYGGRVDHAIGAYHKGLTNTDDIIYDYLTRQEEGIAYPDPGDRQPFIDAIERHNVTYLTLWNDRRCRQMLNGLRTVEGEVTSPDNRHMALGDESDLYPWKVLGSLAAYREGEQHVVGLIEKYSGRRDASEVRGIPQFATLQEMKTAAGAGRLIRTRVPMTDQGVAGSAQPSSEEGRLCYAVTPELEGYLFSLLLRLRQATEDDRLQLPIQALSEAHVLASGDSPNAEQQLHLRGVAFTLVPYRLDRGHEKMLRAILQSDYLDDRIYLTSRSDGSAFICLNPRYGHDFMASYERNAKAVATSQPNPKPAPYKPPAAAAVGTAPPTQPPGYHQSQPPRSGGTPSGPSRGEM